jgi:hypothetical protein
MLTASGRCFAPFLSWLAQGCYGWPSHVAAKTVVKQFAPDTFSVRDNGGRDVIELSQVIRRWLKQVIEAFMQA